MSDASSTTHLDSNSPKQTQRLGQLLAQHLPSTTIALQGTLGAGKTNLTKAIAIACGVPEKQVTSPTFVIAQQHLGDRPLLHADLYRLKDEDEFWELGAEEWFSLPGLVLIEWADKFLRCMPEDRLDIEIQVTGPTSRRFVLIPRGSFPADSLQAIAAAWQDSPP